ncbi:MAG: hypothetical protein WCD79_08620 [Chthoniobacteraceae bacterium]
MLTSYRISSLFVAVLLLAGASLTPAARGVTPAQADVDIPLTSFPIPGVKKPVLVGAGVNGVVVLSVPTLQRVVMAPGDVLGAAFEFDLKQTGHPQGPAAGLIAVYRLIHPDAPAPVAGTDYDATPLATIPVEKIPDGKTGPKRFEVAGLGDFAREALTSHPEGVPLLFVATGIPAGSQYNINLGDSVLNVTVVSHPKTSIFEPVIRPVDGVYAHNQGGHLYYGGKRLRLWGVVRPQVPNVEAAERIAKVGFNAVRLWGPRDAAIDQKTGEFVPVKQGDGSGLDEYDRIYAACRKAGLFVMSTGLMSSQPTKEAPLDAQCVWLKDGKDWDQWLAAIAMKPAPDGWMLNYAAAFDDRLFKVRQQEIKNYLTHVNPYTGKSYAQEEGIAVFELSNENAHVKRTLENGFAKWPPYFVSELQQRWNQWLTQRYHDDAGLARAWTKLESGESLAAGGIKLEPVGKNHAAYPDGRMTDLVRFLIGIDVDLHHRLEAYARSFAPKNVGVAAAPFSYDTQYQPSIPWLYDNTQTDVANFGMYFWLQQSALAVPPSMYVMDSHTVQGKITVIYETMIGRPSPYRAEYPYRLAALASWEDWDAIFFHYWTGFIDKTRTFPDEAYLAAPLTYISPSHFWTSVYFEKDPALLSPMAIAGQMFISGAIAPAPDPVTYVIGGNAIYKGAVNMTRATFSRGARIRFDPQGKDGITIEGAPEGTFATPPTGAIEMGTEVVWDWQHGRMIIDTPTAKAYVGVPAGNYRFKDGITVGGFAGKFVSFGMISADGKPLSGPDASSKILISAADNAKNTAFHIKLKDGDTTPPGGPLEIQKFIDNDGVAPVLVDKVPYKIWFPQELTGHFNGYDLALRQRLDKAVSGGVIDHDGSELYLATLAIDHRGSVLDTPPSDNVSSAVAAGTTGSTGSNIDPRAVPGLQTLWNPMPGVTWADAMDAVEKNLRQAGVTLDAARGADDNLHIANTDAFFHKSADVDVVYAKGLMEKINVTFSQPPELVDVIAAYDKQLGPSISKIISPGANAPSTVKWLLKKDGQSLSVTATEVQGVLSLSFSRD